MVGGAYVLLLSVPISQQTYQCTPVFGPGCRGRKGWERINDHNNDRKRFFLRHLGTLPEVSSPNPATLNTECKD